MKWIAKFNFLPLVLIFTFAVSAKADDPAASPTPADTSSPAKDDDRELVKALSQYIVVINKPIYVYNWFNAAGRNSIWTSHISGTSGAGYDHLVSGAKRYFQGFCTNDAQKDPKDCTSEDVRTLVGRGGYYGAGLYASTDPVATSSFGGSGSGSWVLMQIRLPVGFRLATLVWNVKDNSFSPAARAQLDAMQCPVSGGTSILNVLESFLQRGTNNGGVLASDRDKACTLNIRRLLRDRLKIDGLYYSYNGTSFEECGGNLSVGVGANARTVTGNSLRSAAFVIGGTDKFKPSDVKVFNSQTTDAVADRIRITTLFYRSGGSSSPVSPTNQALIAATTQYYNANGIPNEAGYRVSAWVTNGCYSNGNYANVCGDWYLLVDARGVTKYAPLAAPPGYQAGAVPPPPLKTQISAQTAPSMMTSLTGGRSLLWSDLEGMEQDADIGTWIKGSLLGCRDIMPFGAAPSLRYGRKYPTSSIDAEIDHEGK